MDILINQLLNSFAVSGKEDRIISLIKDNLNKLKNKIDLKVYEDRFGNLIAKIGSGNEKVMICTHVDNSGVIVVDNKDKEFKKIFKLGTIDASKLVGRFIKFENGVTGFIYSSKEEPGDEDLFVDLNISIDKGEEIIIETGDMAEFSGKSFKTNKSLIGPNLHSRICAYILIKVLEEIKNDNDLNKEVYLVFTREGEIGFKGSKNAACEIKPNIAIVLNAIEAKDYLKVKNDIKLYGGPIISIFDRSLVIHNDIKKLIESSAKVSNIKLQYSINDGKNEGGSIHKEVGGIKTGMLGLPCRYINTCGESVSINDIKDSIQLLKNIIGLNN